MKNNSNTVKSNQSDIHEDLMAVAHKHLTTKFHKPYKTVCKKVFGQIEAQVERHGGPLIFDSGCGTGESTIAIAEMHPQALVIGIDKSEVRLSKTPENKAMPNHRLYRADVIDIWRLAARAGWRLAHHYLLYPNPWPKKRQFKRRWHAHPVFPDLLSLGGILHLRSNWRLYLEEFATVAKYAGGLSSNIEILTISTPISGFEKNFGQANNRFSN